MITFIIFACVHHYHHLQEYLLLIMMRKENECGAVPYTAIKELFMI